MPDAYNVRLMDRGYDLLENVGAARSGAVPEQDPIVYSSTSIHPVVHEGDALTLVIDNHVTPSAQMTIEIYYALGA